MVTDNIIFHLIISVSWKMRSATFDCSNEKETYTLIKKCVAMITVTNSL
jgi:hypothetical protein